MTTQYTPILKLALPVTGELSGTWGDVVNDNITSMVEQAIAGLATISTWTGNSHTLTTANGTTSESRCAMLVAQNGAGLTAAGEIVCPASSKLYVLKNDTSYAITLKTAAGTGVAVASGNTAFLFCDGTNVNACVTTIVDGRVTGNLTVDGNATVNGNTTLGNATSDTITATARFASGLTPSADNTYDLGSTGNSWKDLYIDGTAYLALVDINGGTIDGVSIGASTAATIINVDNLRLDGNTISSTDTNGNVVIAPNGTGDVQLDADTVRVGDSGAAATLTSNGAGALTVTTGGAADLTLSTNSGTTSGTIVIANGAGGNITLTPEGTGDVILSADRVQIGDANTDTTLTTNGTGSLNLTTNNGTNSGTIQIAQGANGNITLTPNGTGAVSVPKLVWSNGTSGRVPYLTTGGQFTDSANLTFNGTDLTVSGAVNAGSVNATTLDLTNLEVTNIKAKDGTAAMTIADSTGAVTVSSNFSTQGNTTLGNAAADNVTVTGTVTSNLLFTDATYDIGALGANRPRDMYLSRTIYGANGSFGGLTAGASMFFTGATSSDVAGVVFTVPTIQNWSVGGVGNDFQFYPTNAFTGTATLTLKASAKQTIVGESVTTAAGGASIRLVVTGSGGGGIQMTGSTNAGGAAMVPIAGGGNQFYSYSGAQGSETYTLRGQYDNNGSWALGSAGGAIISNIGVATYGGLYSDRGATGGAAQTLFTMAASSGSNFGQITNTGTRWALGYGSSVTTATDVLTWTSGNTVGINAGTPSATLEVSASFANSAIEEIARISRVGGTALYGNNRAAALTFYDQSNGTLTAAVAGVRVSPSGDYNGNIALYYNNTGGANATSVSQLTLAAKFGSYGALFGQASGFNTGAGLAIYSAGNYTNLTIQTGDATAGSLVDFTNVSNVLQYRMGTNHNSIGNGNFAFSYGTGPSGVSWSVLSSGTFGAGNINVTNLDGGGYVRFASNMGKNASPASTGTGQDAALRLRGGDNAVLDMGLNSVNTWIQATDKSALQNNYYLHLNPNGGTVAINAGTTAPPIADGLYVLNKSDAALAQFRSTLASGGYIAMHNGSIVPLFMGFGGTLSAAATTNDGVIRYNSGYKLYFSADGQYRAYFDTNGKFNMDAGSMSGVNLSTTQGTNIIVSQSWNDGSAHSLGGLQNYTGVILVRQNGLQAIPFYCNGGGGIAYQWTVLNPQTGTWSTGSGPTVNFADNGSSPNSYSIVFSGGGGTATIQRTGGSAAYSVYVQVFAYG